VQHHTFQIKYQLDATISPVYYIDVYLQLDMFRASSCPSSGATATAVAASGLPSELRGSSAVGRGRTDHDQQHCYHHPRSNGKPEAATAVVELLIMGMRMPETCRAVFKRQVLNLRYCCIWLVDSVESMMMHGLANPKSSGSILPLYLFVTGFKERWFLVRTTHFGKVAYNIIRSDECCIDVRICACWGGGCSINTVYWVIKVK
jgi:hypothetical protein